MSSCSIHPPGCLTICGVKFGACIRPEGGYYCERAEKASTGPHISVDKIKMSLSSQDEGGLLHPVANNEQLTHFYIPISVELVASLRFSDCIGKQHYLELK